MILNLFFTKINIKIPVKTTEQYKREQLSIEVYENNKLRHADMVMRKLY